MKFFFGILGCLGLGIVVWGIAGSLMQGALAFLSLLFLFCSMIAFFLKMRDNQMVIMRSISTHNAAVLLEIKHLKEAKK